MAGMNRLSPLISRRQRLSAGANPLAIWRGRGPRWSNARRPWSAQGQGAIAMPAPKALEVPAWLDDLRLFATGWIGGLIFFGTLFG
jgi:hypothetical protein